MATIYIISLTTHNFNTKDFEVKDRYTYNVGAYSTKESAVDYLKYEVESNEYKLKAHPHNRIERTLNSLRVKTYEMVVDKEVCCISEWTITEMELQ
jgi:hypothetical protein